MPKKNGQADRPATKEDVQEGVDELAQITDKNFRRVDQRLEEHDRRFDRLEKLVMKVKQIAEMTLNIVKGIDQNRKEEKKLNLPERVEKLEDDVLKIKARVY